MKKKKLCFKDRFNQLIQRISLGKTFTTFNRDKCPIESKSEQKMPAVCKKEKSE